VAEQKSFRGGGGGKRQDNRVDDGLFEKVIHINRVANVAKGGRTFRFTALVVVGDGAGQIGIGFGKSREVPVAVQKGREQAVKDLHTINLKGQTIPHEVLGIFGAGKVIFKPASRGTGIKAGGPVRALAEALGIRDILTKSLGSNNPITVVRAAMMGLESLRDRNQVFEMLGKNRKPKGESA
jgi:small subunit ribosomal protein S5